MDVVDPSALESVLRRHGVRAASSLGQRFLVDRGVLRAILDAAELSADDDVLEVGPGPGVLTAELAARARSVTAVEIDERLVAVLGETLAGRGNVNIVRADALAVDLFASRRPGGAPIGLAPRLALRLLDVSSYSAGLWAGMVRRRSLRAALPRSGAPSAPSS